MEVPADEQRQRINAICTGQRWILDTAYSKWLDLVMPRAEIIVALDYPRWLSLGRLVRRSLMRALDRRTICNGNTESFRQLASRDSIVVWHFCSFARKRARINAWAADSGACGRPPYLAVRYAALAEGAWRAEHGSKQDTVKPSPCRQRRASFHFPGAALGWLPQPSRSAKPTVWGPLSAHGHAGAAGVVVGVLVILELLEVVADRGVVFVARLGHFLLEVLQPFGCIFAPDNIPGQARAS